MERSGIVVSEKRDKVIKSQRFVYGGKFSFVFVLNSDWQLELAKIEDLSETPNTLSRHEGGLTVQAEKRLFSFFFCSRPSCSWSHCGPLLCSFLHFNHTHTMLSLSRALSSSSIIWVVVAVLMTVVPAMCEPPTINDTCVLNPARSQCVDYNLPPDAVESDIEQLCKSMPDMWGCTVDRICTEDKPSGSGDFCKPFSILKDLCLDMPTMPGCGDYGSMCSNVSVVNQCKTKVTQTQHTKLPLLVCKCF